MPTSSTHADTADQKAKTGLEWLARAGYAARGAVYLLVGGLAIDAAVYGGKAEGSKGALHRIAEIPLGKLILIVVAVGLIGYALWRAAQAILDADNHGTDGKGLIVRTGLGVSAVTHTFLAILAISLAFGLGFNSGGGDGGGGGGGGGEQSWSAWLMGKGMWGRLLIGLIGLAVISAGVAQFIKGAQAKFMKYFDPKFRDWPYAKPICRVGLMTRGGVFCLIGFFIVLAAYRYNPDNAQGLGGILTWLARDASWLLIIIAVGLLAFGVYSILEAVYRRVSPPDRLVPRLT